MNKMVIMRGVPGSGKSTYIANHLPGAVVCSANHYFSKSGKYVFDPSKLGAAHGECFRNAARAVLLEPASLIVIDNTNVYATEIAPYMLLGESHGYEVEIIALDVDPEDAAARNVHGVPQKTVNGMHARLWSEQLPPWWKQVVVTQ